MSPESLKTQCVSTQLLKMNTKQILVVVAMALAVAGMIWDARIGLAGLIILGAANLIPQS